jgi:ABC-type sugar transport system ATPase subunit
MPDESSIVEFREISKRYAGVQALTSVTLGIARGECHGLMGENGAGKSTLGKILAGVVRPDEGQILIDGRAVRFSSPRDAMRAGVGIVHQELAFCPHLSVGENLCLGRYPRRFFLADRSRVPRLAEEQLRRVSVHLDVQRPMSSLSTAQEQLVQIAGVLRDGVRVLIFDEPTSSLSAADALHLMDLVERLRAAGTTILYVSHRMPEVMRLCDRISVLRDGKLIKTVERGQATEDQLVSSMIGRQFQATSRLIRPGAAADAGQSNSAPSDSGEPAITVRGLASPGIFQDISFSARGGEIVGIAGLVGAGRSEVARAIFGLDKRAQGDVLIGDKRLALGSVRRSLAAGLALVPEDRKRQGLVLPMSVRANVSMSVLRRLSRMGLLPWRREAKLAERSVRQLAIKTAGIGASVGTLSGGNQQKVAIAKWLARDARVFIADEPTRGVDVASKAAIHDLLAQLAQQGVAVIVISSELPELLRLADRILVMRGGRLVGQVPAADATEEVLLRMMAGVGKQAEN